MFGLAVGLGVALSAFAQPAHAAGSNRWSLAQQLAQQTWRQFARSGVARTVLTGPEGLILQAVVVGQRVQVRVREFINGQPTTVTYMFTLPAGA